MRKILKATALLSVLSTFFAQVCAVSAAEANSIAITISPPKIENNMSAGESWTSAVTVINNGLSDITIFPTVQDFKARPEGGVEYLGAQTGADGDDRYRLSKWITMSRDPINISAQAKTFVPFTINIPDGAEPGGHYAAILIGNNPSEKPDGSYVSVSSMVSCLLLLNVRGEADERGGIRSFETNRKLYSDSQAKFSLIFENKGNVHLQPQGEIAIYNIWGRQSGLIKINQGSEYGNVLPESFRRWDFDWDAGDGLSSLGRYTAKLALSYGVQGRQTDTGEVSFWIINFKLAGIVGGSIILLGLALYFFIRLSVRRAVKRAKLGLEHAGNQYSPTLDIRNKTNLPTDGKEAKKIKKIIIRK